MPKKKPNKEDLRTRLAELSGWNTATRDDAYVAQALHSTRSLDQIFGLNEAVFFDEFFFFLKEIEAWSFLEDLDPKQRKGGLYPFIKFVLATIMRCVGGVQSTLAMQDLLLTDPALMALLGFNGAQVRQGSCDRGASLRKKPTKIRGAFSYETIADNIAKIELDKLSKLFNGAIRCLAKHGFFPKDVDLVIDATDDEATPNYKTDNGDEVPHVTREKRPDVRANGHAKKIKVTVYGWKIWIAFESISGLPVAMTIDGINVTDNIHAYQVLDQACKNLEGYSKVHSVSFDRGFLDGKLLWKCDKETGVIVYIPTKSNMDITIEAREIARRVEALAKQGKKQDGAIYKERIEKISRGSGKSAWIEERTTTVVRIRDLPCDWWTAEGASSKANAKSFVPKLVNATVVLRWDGAPKDEEKEVVILDTDPSKDPFAGFDAYDERSKIENTINREAKESWFLEHHPKRSEAGVRVHAYFTLTCMALTTAFRKYLKDAEEAEIRGEELGITRYRRQLRMLNYDRAIVFCGPHFGVFKNYELMLLVGVKVKESELMGETPEGVLARYTAKLNTS
jgi:hypothetical protein